MADKFLQGLAGFISQGVPAFLQGQEIKRRRRDDEDERRRFDERMKRDDARYTEGLARQDADIKRDEARYNEGLTRQDAAERRRAEDARQNLVIGKVAGDLGNYENDSQIAALLGGLMRGAKPGQFTQPGGTFPKGYGLLPDNTTIDPTVNFERSYAAAGKNKNILREEGLDRRAAAKEAAQARAAQIRASAMRGNAKDQKWSSVYAVTLREWGDAAVAADAADAAVAEGGFQGGEAPIPPAPAPNPLAGLLGGVEGMGAARSALGAAQEPIPPSLGLFEPPTAMPREDRYAAPEGEGATMDALLPPIPARGGFPSGPSPERVRKDMLADSLVNRREAQTEADQQRLAQLQRRVDLAFQSEGNLNKYRNARLAETKRLNNFIVGLKGRQVSVSEGLLAQRQLEQAWDEEYQATRLLLDEASLNGRLANQEAGRYNQRLNDINTTIRTILRSPSVTPEMMTQVQTLAAEGKQIENQMFSTMGTPAVRDPATGAITGFQQKAPATDKGRQAALATIDRAKAALKDPAIQARRRANGLPPNELTQAEINALSRKARGQ